MSSPSLSLQDNQSVKIFVIGLDAASVPGAQLPAGATIAITSADPTIATVSQDATPQPAPDGTPTIASASVSPATPVKPNTPVQVNVAVTNADGSAGPTGSGTVTIVPGAEATISVQFGTPA